MISSTTLRSAQNFPGVGFASGTNSGQIQGSSMLARSRWPTVITSSSSSTGSNSKPWSVIVQKAIQVNSHILQQNEFSPAELPSYLKIGGFQQLRDKEQEKRRAKHPDISLNESAMVDGGLDDSTSLGQSSNFPRLDSSVSNITRVSSSSTSVIGLTPSHTQTRTQASVPQVPLQRSYNELDIPVRFAPSAQHFPLQVSGDGLEVSFTGKMHDVDPAAAAVRSNCPIPYQCGVYYFEVEILSKGHKGEIGIGFQKQDVDLSRLPGWENNSWGYHGDDGQSFQEHQHGEPFGPRFTTGDIVGCIINFATNEALFTKNGTNLGRAFTDIATKGPLWPVVGLKTPGERIRVNFGAKSFKFDIDHYIQDVKIQTWSLINSTIPLPVGSDNITRDRVFTDFTSLPTSSDQLIDISSSIDPKTLAESDSYLYSSIDELILDFLIHHGHVETARAMAKRITQFGFGSSNPEIEQDESPIVKEMLNRQRVRTSILNGDIKSAIFILEQNYPSVLSTDRDLYFHLKCRHFIEMFSGLRLSNMDIDSTDQVPFDQAMEYGRDLTREFGFDQRPHIQKTLQEAFSILAYEDIKSSAVAYLLDDNQRQNLANKVNSAILVSLNRNSSPRLELLYKQAMVCLNENVTSHSGPSSLINLITDLEP